MLKQNQRSEKIFQKLHNFHLNKPLLMGMIACLLSVSLMTSASAKELRINLTESLDMSSNDKKPKDLAQKAKPKEKAKSEKKEVKKPEKPKPKPSVKIKPADVKKKPADVKTKPADIKKKPAAVKAKPSPANSTKTKHDTVKNSIGNVK
ncbi:MAG: hypothetical protein ACHQW9_02155 [Nitrososphaerales archaeon]